MRPRTRGRRARSFGRSSRSSSLAVARRHVSTRVERLGERARVWCDPGQAAQRLGLEIAQAMCGRAVTW